MLGRMYAIYVREKDKINALLDLAAQAGFDCPKSLYKAVDDSFVEGLHLEGKRITLYVPKGGQWVTLGADHARSGKKSYDDIMRLLEQAIEKGGVR